MTQFNERKGKVESEQLKSLSLRIKEVTSKSITFKGKQSVRHTTYTNQGHLPTEVIFVIDFTDEPVIWSNVPVVENTFADNDK